MSYIESQPREEMKNNMKQDEKSRTLLPKSSGNILVLHATT